MTGVMRECGRTLPNNYWMSTTHQLNIMFTQLSTQPKTDTTYKYRGYTAGFWSSIGCDQVFLLPKITATKTSVCLFSKILSSFTSRTRCKEHLIEVWRGRTWHRETPRFGAQLETKVVTLIKVHSCKDTIQCNTIHCSHLNTCRNDLQWFKYLERTFD